MPTTIRKRPDITERSALIDWLCRKIKGQERQKEVPIAFVKYFGHLARQFKQGDFIADGDGWFDEIYNGLFCPIVDN